MTMPSSSWEAVGQLVAGKTELVSAACKLEGWTVEPGTLYKYQEQYGGTFSGAANCIERTNQLTRAAKRIGNSTEAWSAPIHFLCNSNDHVAVYVPAITTDLAGIQRTLIKTIKEYSEMMNASSEAMEKDCVDQKKVQRIVSECDDVLQIVATYKMQLQAQIK